ncbi:hypothetical protein [Bosea sp. ASV33]|uniref:hypothetical protein n=1 Tax=Bosea sp. ASV33 TaxID=2795106 RepID=UPI0018EB1A4A|nr:hypothetical protein [Bosea sp. ASV33]
MKALDERSRCATLEECDDGYRLTSRIPRDATLGSRMRAKELRRIIGRMIRHAKPLSLVANEHEVSAVFDGSEPEANIKRLLSDLNRRVDEFRRERLHPRVVDELLEISSRERRRWIKDGRLPISGSASFRRGKQDIHFPLHPPDRIARLAQAPDIIAEWRERDRVGTRDIDLRSSQVSG